jgi:hypothetical protein
MWSALTAGAASPAFEGLDDVAELKAWSRRAWWAGHATPLQKARAISELTLTPWRFAKEATAVFRKHAAFVSRRFGTSGGRQLFGILRARVCYGLDPIAYYRFHLFRPERWTQAGRYVQNADTGRVLRWLVLSSPGYVFVFGDKRRFEAWCVEHRLPTVHTLIEFERGHATRTWMRDGTLPAMDLFSKPSNSQAGHGTERWIYRDDGCYVGADGRGRSTEALVAELARQSADIGRPVLLQRALRNAPSEAPLSPGALCTARLTTIRHPHGRPQLLFGIYRMPADARTAVDNFGPGGLAAPVDFATGRLGRAIRKDVRLTPAPVARHPYTGARIEGHQLSHWAEAVSLALRAHEAITWPGVPVIGWDVALLEDGPVLVEANNVPCSTFAQMVLDVPLADSPLLPCLNAHLRECFARSSAR